MQIIQKGLLEDTFGQAGVLRNKPQPVTDQIGELIPND